MGHHGETEEQLLHQLVDAWRDLPARERGDLMHDHPNIAGPLTYLAAHALVRLDLD